MAQIPSIADGDARPLVDGRKDDEIQDQGLQPEHGRVVEDEVPSGQRHWDACFFRGKGVAFLRRSEVSYNFNFQKFSVLGQGVSQRCVL